jgi:hypothetical protein
MISRKNNTGRQVSSGCELSPAKSNARSAASDMFAGGAAGIHRRRLTLIGLLARQKHLVADFNNGVVSLWGQAPSDDDRQELERLLLALPSVERVNNQLTIPDLLVELSE